MDHFAGLDVSRLRFASARKPLRRNKSSKERRTHRTVTCLQQLPHAHRALGILRQLLGQLFRHLAEEFTNHSILRRKMIALKELQKLVHGVLLRR